MLRGWCCAAIGCPHPNVDLASIGLPAVAVKFSE
jgi:hypothetical protein